ncbi:HdeD family acid-resistance protein [Nonomuraea sediminis]|uniref:HdeD family acid-resistance protein n=1 Tax=Nonomuraea sediminis TaxID=2835864 RepID=UPI001BDC843C|nr:DUF308 domain-containing protein [Nonomuraea sediminis]
MAWPGITVGAFVILFAVYAFLAGVMDFTRAFNSDRAGPVIGWVLLALLSIAAGVGALVWPGLTAFVLTIWVAGWALVTGVTEVVMVFQRGESGGERIMWALSGLVSIALAVVLFVRPDIGALSMASVFGLFSLVYGVSAIVVSLRVRKIGQSQGSQHVESACRRQHIRAAGAT